jgi:hypothetical protein
VVSLVLKREDSLAEVALSQRVVAVNSLMLDLLVLHDSESAAFADNLHEHALVDLVGAQQELIIGELVGAALVGAFEPDLAEGLLLKFVKLLILSSTFARLIKKLGVFGGGPFAVARLADVSLAFATLFALDHNLVAEHARQRLQQQRSRHTAVALEHALRRDTLLKGVGEKVVLFLHKVEVF